MNRSELVQRIVSSRSILSDLIEQVPEKHRDRTMIAGMMTLKDIIIHICWFELEMVNMLETMKLQGSPLWELGTDERNTRIQELHADLPWQQVIFDFEKIQPVLIELIEGLEEAALENPTYFNNMPEEWIPFEIIAGNTFEHYEHHIRDIKEFLIDIDKQT
ncbi:MAG: hypothetical protein CVU41_10315 [Chloroflexi bacterium HGW-Chloroflexi-3]|nr:MAG: hypothetical protein CVU41_10315 [Chloroflexi bacterium HGW-Chloroflexi-3]